MNIKLVVDAEIPGEVENRTYIDPSVISDEINRALRKDIAMLKIKMTEIAVRLLTGEDHAQGSNPG